MSGWSTANLGDAMLAGDALARVESLFASEHEEAGRPDGMAVFVRHESEGRLHCEVEVYFSPAAIRVARAMDAIPCAKPSPDGLGLLAGPDAAWPALFPRE